ncbi:MAG: hypothetical protein HQL50_01260 [Magnetococcales bacterium]|nr:hypothetical protein [Magnetococcales bacterium]
MSVYKVTAANAANAARNFQQMSERSREISRLTDSQIQQARNVSTSELSSRIRGLSGSSVTDPPKFGIDIYS